MTWAITFIRFVLAFLGVAKSAEQIIRDGQQRDAGAAEQTAREGSVIASREKTGAQIEDQVSGLSDKALDDQLKGN